VLLGAILAPTDAVVVATLLRQVGLPPSLRAAIVGESLFNDGAGVVLFLLALGVTQGETFHIGHGQILIAMLREIGGGAALGFAGGWLAAMLMRRIDDDGLLLLISLALVFGSYRIANLLELSGPIAVVCAGLKAPACAWCLRPEQPRVLRLVPHAGEIGAQRARTDFVERRPERARRRCRDGCFKGGEHALAVGLAERDEADAGGNPIRGQCVQERLQRRFAGNAMAGAGHAHGNGQRDGAVPRRVEARQRLAGPGGACRIDKGAALGRGLQEALLGWHQGGGQFGDRAQAFVVIRGDGAVGVNEQHRIAEA
jgi:Sodium/hydrogen exchanger family